MQQCLSLRYFTLRVGGGWPRLAARAERAVRASSSLIIQMNDQSDGRLHTIKSKTESDPCQPNIVHLALFENTFSDSMLIIILL